MRTPLDLRNGSAGGYAYPPRPSKRVRRGVCVPPSTFETDPQGGLRTPLDLRTGSAGRYAYPPRPSKRSRRGVCVPPSTFETEPQGGLRSLPSKPAFVHSYVPESRCPTAAGLRGATSG